MTIRHNGGIGIFLAFAGLTRWLKNRYPDVVPVKAGNQNILKFFGGYP
jgi:hypothetical protein